MHQPSAESNAKRTVVDLPTSGSRYGEAPSRLAHIEGTLASSWQEGDGCVWLGTGEDEQEPLVWPRGFKARFRPLEILDDKGKVVAHEGDLISAAGGYAPAKGKRCMFGHSEAFWIQSHLRVVRGNRPGGQSPTP